MISPEQAGREVAPDDIVDAAWPYLFEAEDGSDLDPDYVGVERIGHAALVHHIWRIRGQASEQDIDTVVALERRRTWALRPNVMDPSDAQYTYEGGLAINRVSEVVPRYLGLGGSRQNIVIMEDLGPVHTLEATFEDMTHEDYWNAGLTLGSLHRDLRGSVDAIRPDDDRRIYEEIARERGYPTPRPERTQLVHGGAWLKNFVVTDEGEMRMVDTAYVHLGNPHAEKAVMAAQIIKYSLTESVDTMRDRVGVFLMGYAQAAQEDVNTESALVCEIVARVLAQELRTTQQQFPEIEAGLTVANLQALLDRSARDGQPIAWNEIFDAIRDGNRFSDFPALFAALNGRSNDNNASDGLPYIGAVESNI